MFLVRNDMPPSPSLSQQTRTNATTTTQQRFYPAMTNYTLLHKLWRCDSPYIQSYTVPEVLIHPSSFPSLTCQSTLSPRKGGDVFIVWDWNEQIKQKLSGSFLYYLITTAIGAMFGKCMLASGWGSSWHSVERRPKGLLFVCRGCKRECNPTYSNKRSDVDMAHWP